MSAIDALGCKSISAFEGGLEDCDVGAVLGVERFYPVMTGQGCRMLVAVGGVW
jgi:hypothetical protein